MSWTTDPKQARWFAEVYWPRRSDGAGEIAVIGREIILTKCRPWRRARCEAEIILFPARPMRPGQTAVLHNANGST
jgi:hypothetical protein